MSELPAFRQLQEFIKTETAPKPHRKGSKPETANSLTNKIITYLKEQGQFAARIYTTGLYDEKLGKYRQSGATTGVPDVISCINGTFVGFEIKIGKDKLSKQQERVSLQINTAGGFYVITRCWADFVQFYTELTKPPFA